MKLPYPSAGAPGGGASARSTANDAALRDAAVRLIAVHGWDETTTTRIGETAGLSHGAVYARYADKSEVGAALWRDACFPSLSKALTSALEAGTDRTADTFSEAMLKFFDPSLEIVAAVELIAAARFDGVLGRTVLPQASDLMTEWCRPRGTRTPAQAASSCAIVYLALGMVMGRNRPWRKTSKPRHMLARFHSALAHPVRARRLPDATATYLDESPFSTGDASIDRLLTATTESIGEHGYHGASVARICRSAGVSQGYLFRRYPTKLDLFLAATDASHQRGLVGSLEFLEETREKYGPAVAEAVTWRELQRPGLATKRSVALEVARLSEYDKHMAEIVHGSESELAKQRLAAARGSVLTRGDLLGHFHMDICLGLGVLLVPMLVPDVWTLPFDTVTTRLVATDPWLAD